MLAYIGRSILLTGYFLGGLGAALFAASPAAWAQVPGGNLGLDPEGVPYSSKYYPSFPESNVISLMRRPELTEDQFILRITDPHVKSGCAKMSDYGYFAEYRDIYLDIEITGNIVDLRGQPQYAHFQCDQKGKVPVADVILNRSDIITNKTQQIRLHNGNDTNYYNITLTDDKVMILPDAADEALARRFRPHALPGRKTALVHWFYPLGTLILWAPETAAGGAVTAGMLENYAKKLGLVPLDTVFPDFKSPLTSASHHYFVDTAGRFPDDDQGLRDGKPIGKLVVEKKVFGLEKDEVALDEIVVYAKRPGQYD